MAPEIETLRRVPFAPGDAGDVVGFCVAHGSPFDAALLRRLVLELTSDGEGVFVLAGEAAATVLVATLIDRAANEAGAAILEVLAARRAVAGPAFMEMIVGPAGARARLAGLRALHVPLRPSLAGAAEIAGALQLAGFVVNVTTLEMIRPAAAPPAQTEPAPGPLPDGWRWVDLDDERVAQAHAGLSEIFHGARSFGLSPLPVFRRMVAARTTTWRLLLDGARGDRLVGLVQVAAPGAVRTVGRAPAYRGRGVGARLVNEGLRILLASGAREIALDVEAENDRAVTLYRRFGFQPAERVPTFALGLP